jgi:hypothetical protein
MYVYVSCPPSLLTHLVAIGLGVVESAEVEVQSANKIEPFSIYIYINI